MGFFALLLQLALQLADTLVVDSTYSPPRLREFIAHAVVANRTPPPSLAGYHADVETELALILRDSLGRELVGQLEQLAASAQWQRDGRYDLHVIGYRSQSLGAPYSALTFARMWTVPMLYGNRLVVGMNDGIPPSPREAATARKRAHRDSATGRSYRMVHPLADDRDGFYRFRGGDTVATIATHGRAIRIVRVFVEPVRHPRETLDAFEGELDFDADHYALVRMRGRLVRLTDERNPLLVRSTGVVAVAYMEFENAEIDGRYWLPVYERSEFQAQMGVLGDTRPVFRLVSRFRNYAVAETTAVAAVDSVLPATRASVTYAAHDSVSRFGGWQEPLGSASMSVHAGDFDDLAPDVWKTNGRPRADIWPRRLEDLARYNRVEGLFTGVAGTLRFRDAAPGLTARANFGWAWTEQSVRGAATVSLNRARWSHAMRVERELAATNDFLLPLETGLSIGPLISGTDNYDYVDRRVAAYSVARVLGNVDRGLVTAEAAFASDAPESARMSSVVLHNTTLLPNRLATPGTYARATVSAEYHPRVTGATLTPGFGARFQYQAGRGDLNWQRLDATLAGRRYWRGLALAGRVDGGMLAGTVLPPQQLFELGGTDNLPAYEYKEFGGDRAALGRGLVAWYLPVARTPRRVWRLILPGLSPGIGVGLQGGWAEATTLAARQALLALGGDGITPLSRPTDGIRASGDVRLTLLSGAVGGGITRAIDQPDHWKAFFGFGLGF